jgi:hypothetical protein
MDQLNSVLKQVQQYKANPKDAKLSLPRKREYVETVYLALVGKEIDRRQILAVQPQIADFAITIAFFGCGDSLNKALTAMLKALY